MWPYSPSVFFSFQNKGNISRISHSTVVICWYVVVHVKWYPARFDNNYLLFPLNTCQNYASPTSFKRNAPFFLEFNCSRDICWCVNAQIRIVSMTLLQCTSICTSIYTRFYSSLVTINFFHLSVLTSCNTDFFSSGKNPRQASAGPARQAFQLMWLFSFPFLWSSSQPTTWAADCSAQEQRSLSSWGKTPLSPIFHTRPLHIQLEGQFAEEKKKNRYWCGKWSSLRISEARCHPLIFITIGLEDLPCSFKAREKRLFFPTFISVNVVKSCRQKQISCYSNCRNLRSLCGCLFVFRVKWLPTTECDPSQKK